MKKKLILGLLVFVVLFNVTGCGSKKEENEESNNSSSKFSSKMICKMENENEKDRYEFNFDKNDELVDGIYVVEILKETKIESTYNSLSKHGGFNDVSKNNNVITAKFDTRSSAITQMKYYTKDYKKESIKNYFENNSKSVVWTCE